MTTPDSNNANTHTHRKDQTPSNLGSWETIGDSLKKNPRRRHDGNMARAKSRFPRAHLNKNFATYLLYGTKLFDMFERFIYAFIVARYSFGFIAGVFPRSETHFLVFESCQVFRHCLVMCLW